LKINKKMTIAELMTIDPMIPNILMREGMHCVTCGSAAGETLEQAGDVHGMTDSQIDDLVDRLNDFLSVL
jgi:hybrid cluster-associated redox disulfide protein